MRSVQQFINVEEEKIEIEIILNSIFDEMSNRERDKYLKLMHE